MASKDKSGSEIKKLNPNHDQLINAKHEERREKKQALKIIRRRSHRTGHIPTTTA